MNRTLRFLALLLGVFALSVTLGSHDAWAKKSKADHIEKTGIKSFDEVFGQVDDLDSLIRKAHKSRKSGHDAVVSAMGLTDGTPFSDALKELKKNADGKLKLAMNGSVPQLSVTDAVPSNVENAVAAVNQAMTDYTDTAKSLVEVPKQARSLVKQVQKFPKEFKKEFSSMSITDIPETLKQAKTLKNNIKVTVGVPDRAKKVSKGLKSDLTAVKNTFGSGSSSAASSSPSGSSPGSSPANAPKKKKK